MKKEKTIEQIKAWLKQQPWYKKWKNYTLRQWKHLGSLESFFSFFENSKDLIISGAFNWEQTDEGIVFWDKADRLYQLWLIK